MVLVLASGLDFKMNCSCKVCIGDRKPVKVFWSSYLYFFGTFNYCDYAIRRDKSRGFIVETEDPKEKNEWRINAINSSVMR